MSRGHGTTKFAGQSGPIFLGTEKAEFPFALGVAIGIVDRAAQQSEKVQHPKSKNEN